MVQKSMKKTAPFALFMSPDIKSVHVGCWRKLMTSCYPSVSARWE